MKKKRVLGIIVVSDEKIIYGSQRKKGRKYFAATKN